MFGLSVMFTSWQNHPEQQWKKVEKAKIAKYEEISKDYYMMPVAVGTCDLWDPDGSRFIKSIGQKYGN